MKHLKYGLGLSLLFSVICGCYSGDETLVPKPPYVPVEIEESYVLKFEPKVDILFVIDDSGSMSSHQANLAANMGLFTGAMEQNQFLDYHIGVISTSVDKGGKLFGNPAFVTRADGVTGLAALSRNIVALGTSGDATEKMFDPTYLALGPESEINNPGFLRADAFLVLIFLTDAEDQSVNVGGFKVYDALLRKKANDVNKVLGYGVLAFPELFGDSCSKDGTEPLLNEQFMSFFTNAENSRIATSNLPPLPSARKTLTNIFSLCDVNFGQKLANIGEDIRYRVSQNIPLPKLPVRGTIKLKYGTQYVDSKWWKYDPTGQSLNLHPDIELVEEEGAQFSVVMDQSNPNETIGAPDDQSLVPFDVENNQPASVQGTN